MTFSLSCQEEPLATGVASTPALVLRRATPVPDLVDPALLPAGDASLFVAVSSILHPLQKRHCLIQGPRLEGRRPLQAFKDSFLAKRVQLTSSRVRLGQSFKTVGYGSASCWGDLGAGSVEADVFYIPFIVSVQYIGY